MKSMRPVCLLALGAFLFAAHASTAELVAPASTQGNAKEGLIRYDFSGPGMFTTFRISCYAADPAIAEKAVEACFNRIAELNQIFTDYDPTSELMRLCSPEAKYPVKVSPAMRDLLGRSIEIAQDTEGTYDPTCGHLTQLWRRARRQGKLPPQQRLQAGIQATDWRRVQVDTSKSQVTLEPGTLLDLGGIAKGYAADECLRMAYLRL
jgi:thiamine biosynthesis lipoprotein